MITLPFQRKKERQKREKKEKQRQAVKEKNVLIPKKKPVKKELSVRKEMGESEIAYKILDSPLISEKVTMLEEEGKYVFKVFKSANKKQIKRAIEDIYKTKVDKINILNIKRKRKRIGRIEGFKKGYKKAIVTLKKGEKIEVISR